MRHRRLSRIKCLGECGRRVVHLLPINGQIQPRLVLRFIVGFEEQRAGAAGKVVDGLVRASGTADPDHPGEDAGHFGRRVELSFTFAGLGSKVTAQEQ